MYTTTQPSAAETHGETATAGAEPTKFVKRIGSTTYVVTVRFSESAAKTLDDKILRLIEGEGIKC
jgi:hypothetical protein